MAVTGGRVHMYDRTARSTMYNAQSTPWADATCLTIQDHEGREGAASGRWKGFLVAVLASRLMQGELGFGKKAGQKSREGKKNDKFHVEPRQQRQPATERALKR